MPKKVYEHTWYPRKFNLYRKKIGEETFYKFDCKGRGIQITLSHKAAMVTHVFFHDDIKTNTVRSNVNEWRHAGLMVFNLLGKLPDRDYKGKKKEKVI